LGERSKDDPLIEWLGSSVVLYEGLRGLSFCGKQCLLKLFQLRSRRVGEVTFGDGKGPEVIIMSLPSPLYHSPVPLKSGPLD
jgi:hypothetical protein